MSLAHAILAILEIEDGTGYELSKRFKKSVGCFWSASHQQIYKELSKLSEQGWVSFAETLQSGKPAKRYALTERGRQALTHWLQKPSKAGTYKDPFLVKVYASGQRDPAALLKELSEQEAQHQHTLNGYLSIHQSLQTLQPETYAHYRLPHATLKFGIRLEQAWLEWAAALREELSASGISGGLR